MNAELLAAAKRVRETAISTKLKFVLAESCTAGRMAACLAACPGISAHLCGSFVVYRNASKTGWLDIPPAILEDPNHGPVSALVTQMLAVQSLRKTPEAAVGFAITGEIGPGAGESDGLVYCHAIQRESRRSWANSYRLTRPCPQHSDDMVARVNRLDEAAAYALRALEAFLNSSLDK